MRVVHWSHANTQERWQVSAQHAHAERRDFARQSGQSLGRNARTLFVACFSRDALGAKQRTRHTTVHTRAPLAMLKAIRVCARDAREMLTR